MVLNKLKKGMVKMDSIKINEMVLLAMNIQESYDLIRDIGALTLNKHTHDEKLAIKAFYNVASNIRDIIIKTYGDNYSFASGEKKAFAEALYNEFMENEF